MTQFPRKWLVVAVLASSVLWLVDDAPARQEKPAPVRVEKIKYADLGKMVRANQGKVIVVDFWADYCGNCKREFPKLVALQNKHKDDGFVAIAVALDNPDDTTAHDSAHVFLEKMKASGLTNLQIDEDPNLWFKKLGIEAIPCVFVFNREGRIAMKYHEGGPAANYEEIAKLVAELVKK